MDINFLIQIINWSKLSKTFVIFLFIFKLIKITFLIKTFIQIYIHIYPSCNGIHCVNPCKVHGFILLQ